MSGDGLSRWELGEVIGLEPIPGDRCDSPTASVMPMPDGTTRCRCVVCPRCGHHTGNSHQGHNWSFCQVTRTTRTPHFCCGNEFGCELETAAPVFSATCTGPDCGEQFADSETGEYEFATRERMEMLLRADGWLVDPVLCPACQPEGTS